MNSRIIITAGLGVPLSTGPSTILFDVGLWFLFYSTSNWHTIKVLTTHSHVCTHVLLCILNKDQSIKNEGCIFMAHVW